MEPEILRRGKAFHKRAQGDWENTAKGGKINIEYSIPLSILCKTIRHQKTGRLDIFVDELGDFISVVEIKSTNWDKVKEKTERNFLVHTAGRYGDILKNTLI